jgi:putative ABC transport system permease protein
MGIIETILSALRDLSLRKFRSGLATLGIMFAVASVMAMISISDGARRDMLNRIAALGVDNLIIRSIKPVQKESQESTEDRQKDFILSYGLRRIELKHLRDSLPNLKRSIGIKTLRQPLFTSANPRTFELNVMATEPDYLPITRSSIVRGRFFTHTDQEAKQMVCVLGVDAARKLLTYHEPLGASIRIGTFWFEVVGLISNTANLRESGGDDINNAIFIPLSTAELRFGDFQYTLETGGRQSTSVELHGAIIQLENDEYISATAERIDSYLEKSRKRKDYELVVPRQLMKQKADAQRSYTIVMATIAAISLLIGGIGIMNIMLANVSDRRKEIGTRRALGARRIDIISQFLFEAATLTTLGGIVGLGLGWLVSTVITKQAGFPTYISPWTIALSLSVSSMSGLVFGFWPAHTASKVNPIEALRSD